MPLGLFFGNVVTLKEPPSSSNPPRIPLLTKLYAILRLVYILSSFDLRLHANCFTMLREDLWNNIS